MLIEPNPQVSNFDIFVDDLIPQFGLEILINSNLRPPEAYGLEFLGVKVESPL